MRAPPGSGPRHSGQTRCRPRKKDDSMNFWHAAYRRLALAFPHELKLAYGDEMLQTGEDAIDYLARRHGFAGLLRILLDLLLRLPAEYLSEVRGDLRYAIRTLLKSPGYAFVGILSIGLGIGLTTNLYTAAWTLLTRTLSGVTDPNRLVTAEASASFPWIERYRDQKDLFTGVAAVENDVPFNVCASGETAKPERTYGHL